MIIKEVNAVIVLNSRKEMTIKFSIKTNKGVFTTIAPSGKSKGKNESKPWNKSILRDLKVLNNLNIKEITSLADIEKISKKYSKKLGANSLYVLEGSMMKALAKDNDKELWQLLNPKAKRIPKPLGNSVGGGLHTKDHVDRTAEIPEFQEFLYYTDSNKRLSVKEAIELNDKAYKKTAEILKKYDKEFKSKRNDEGAWITSLNNEEIIMLMAGISKELGLRIGIDVAGTTFYHKGIYYYHNGETPISREEQIHYINRLIEKYELGYIEDPMMEEDFEGFHEINKEQGEKSMITGDDLTVTHKKLLMKAITKKSINAIIIKPNQNGSIIETMKVTEMAKNHGMKIIVSHRSGETNDDTIADLAVAWNADYLKCGIYGIERRAKLKRLIEIERMIKGRTRKSIKKATRKTKRKR